MESPRKKTTAALLAGLTAGGAAGAMLFAPGVSLAQEDTSTDTTVVDDAATDAAADTAGHRHPGRRGERLANLAEIIGIDEDALKTALKDGQTIAEVAEANGVDSDVLVDQLVADATARIEERLAELPTRIEEMVNREFDGQGPRGRGGLDGPPEDAPVDDAGD